MHGTGRIPDEIGYLVLNETGAVVAVSFLKKSLSLIKVDL